MSEFYGEEDDPFFCYICFSKCYLSYFTKSAFVCKKCTLKNKPGINPTST